MRGRRSGGVDYGGCWSMCESEVEPQTLREVLADISSEQRGQYRARREPSAGSPREGLFLRHGDSEATWQTADDSTSVGRSFV